MYRRFSPLLLAKPLGHNRIVRVCCWQKKGYGVGVLRVPVDPVCMTSCLANIASPNHHVMTQPHKLRNGPESRTLHEDFQMVEVHCTACPDVVDHWT